MSAYSDRSSFASRIASISLIASVVMRMPRFPRRMSEPGPRPRFCEVCACVCVCVFVCECGVWRGGGVVWWMQGRGGEWEGEGEENVGEAEGGEVCARALCCCAGA